MFGDLEVLRHQILRRGGSLCAAFRVVSDWLQNERWRRQSVADEVEGLDFRRAVARVCRERYGKRCGELFDNTVRIPVGLLKSLPQQRHPEWSAMHDPSSLYEFRMGETDVWEPSPQLARLVYVLNFKPEDRARVELHVWSEEWDVCLHQEHRLQHTIFTHMTNYDTQRLLKNYTAAKKRRSE